MPSNIPGPGTSGAYNSTGEDSSLDAADQLDTVPAGQVYTTGPLVASIPAIDTTPPSVAKPARTRRRLFALFLVILAIVLTLGSVWMVRHAEKPAATATADTSVSARFAPLDISLEDLARNGSLLIDGAPSLSINGQLKVNNSLIVSPTSAPANAVAGQIYYSPQTNTLRYFNGTAFVDLVASDTNIVTNIGGLSGAVSVGGNLAVQNGQLVATGSGTSSGVASIQGQVGNVNFTSGGGIAIDGTTLTNSGVTSIGGQTGTIAVGNGLSISGGTLTNTGVNSLASGTPSLIITDGGNGNLTITNIGGGSATVSSPGGTSGKLARFTGAQVIADSIITDSGTAVSITGDLNVSGNLSLGTLLSVANGGTGAASLANNGVLIGQGTSPVTAVTAAGGGLCLMSTAGAPAFQACPGGTGVTSLNGLSGALSIANSSAAGSTITIQDASTSQKGIAQFNSTNFSATGGTVNTIQDINAAASPTFAGVNTNSITPSGALALGATAQVFTLQGNSTSTITATSGGNTTTLSFATPTAGVNYRVPTAAAGTYDLCTTALNCVGLGGGLTGAGTTGKIAKYTGANTLGDSLLSETGSTVGVTGSLDVSAAATITGAASLNGGATVVGTLTANTITPTGSLTVGATSQSFTLQGNAASLISATNGLSTTGLTFQSPTANVTYRLATATAGTYDVCTTAGNCSGVGGVTSLNGLIGVLVLANASGSGGTVTIDDASTSQKGIAQFNSTNFTASGGTVNTIQNITTTSSPTFSAINTNTITPSGALTVGATAQAFTLQGSSASVITATSGGFSTTIDFATPTANVIYQLQAASAGTYNICTTAGNCNGLGGGVTTSGGTTNRLAKFNGAQTITDSIISDDGSTVTIAGVLSVNTITPTGALTIGATSQNLTLRGASTSLSATASGITNTLTFATPASSNKTITLPNATGTVAVSASGPIGLDSAGNITCTTCVTSGGGGGGQSAVDSLNGLVGAITLANATGAGSVVTIDDASTSQKGIAQFNSTNFSASSGTVNTIQDIAATAAPTFARLSLTSSQASNAMLTANNTNVSASGNLIEAQLNGSARFSVNPAGNVAAAGDINTATTYRINGTAGLASLTCSGGQLLQNAVVAGGIVTGGSCVAPVTGGVTAIGTIDSQTKSANGGVISGTSLYFQTADASNPGLVSTGTQTFAGAKTFNGAITASGGISGDGSGLTNLNASNLASGTVANGRLSGSYTSVTGTGALAAGSIASGFGTISTGNTIATTSTITGAIINATTKFQINGVDGASTTCSGGQFLQNQAVVGGITTGGTCATPTDTGVTTVGTIDSQTKAANGAVISGTSIYMQTADASNPGLVSTGTQVFAGAKTFNSGLNIASGQTYKVNGTQISSADLSNDANLAKLNDGQTFTGANVFNNASNAFTGDGSALTNLNASNLASGTVANGRLSGSYTGVTGTGALAAGSIASGFGTISTGNTISTTSTITGAIINATTKFQLNGVDGATTTCSGGQLLQNAVVAGGIITGGSCVAAVTGGVTAIGTIDSQTKSANGGVIVGTSLYFQTADASNPGLVSTGTQTIAGAKTFSGAATFNSSLTQSGGAFSLTGNATSSLTTTAAALNITAGATSTWQTSTGNLTLQAAAASATLTLTTGAGGTVQVGDTSSAIAQTVNVGTNATASSTTTTTVGSLIGTSSTTIRSGSGALALQSQSGRIYAQSLTNNGRAFEVQDASGNALVTADTLNGYFINNGVSQGNNLLENPSFESAATNSASSGWYFPGTYIILNDGNARTGNQALKVSASSATVDGVAGKRIEVAPGDVYYMEGWLKNTGGTNGSAGFYFLETDKDNTNGVYTALGGSYIAAPGTSYTRISGTVTVGANKKFLTVGTSVRNDSTTGTWYFDDITFRKVNSGGPVTVNSTVDTTTAFQVQNAAGTSLMNVNTVAGVLTLNQTDVNILGIAHPTNVALSTSTSGGSLPNSSTYYYGVTAIAPSGETDIVYSSPTSVTTGGSGAAHRNTLSWNAVSGATGYKVYRSSDAGATWFVNTIAAGTTSIIDNGTTYTWSTSGGNLIAQASNSTSVLNMQTGTWLFMDSGAGNGQSGFNYSVPGNYLVMANYNVGGGLYLEGDSLTVRDTTGFHTNMSLTNTGAATFSNRTNSTTGFQIQNASGSQAFVVDTTATNSNLISNPDFETDASGAAGKGVATAARSTAQKQYGSASLLVTVPNAFSGQGTYVTGFTQTVAAGTYTFSFDLRLASGTWAGNQIVAGYTTTSDTNACTFTTTAEDALTTGFRHYTCTFTAGATVTKVYVAQNDAVIRNFYLDGLRLEAGSTAAPYQAAVVSTAGSSLKTTGNLFVDSTQTNNCTGSNFNTCGGIKFGYDLSGEGISSNRSVSSADNYNGLDFYTNNLKRFYLTNGGDAVFQNSSAVALFTVDASTSRLYVGPTAGDTTGATLVLGTKTTGGDPASGVNGAMYYNEAMQQYRCYSSISSTESDGEWAACGVNPIDRGFSVEDEFMSGTTDCSGSGTIGTLGWICLTIGATPAAAAYNAGIIPTADRPGILRLTPPNTSNNGSSMLLGQSNAPMVLAANNVMKAAVAVGSATSGTTTLRVGMTSQTTATARPTDAGIWWEANPTTSSFWNYCFATGSAATCAASSVSLAANTFARVEIKITATGSGTSAATFLINGIAFNVSGVTISTSPRVSPGLVCYAQNTAQQPCYIDYYQLHGIGSAAR